MAAVLVGDWIAKRVVATVTDSTKVAKRDSEDDEAGLTTA